MLFGRGFSLWDLRIKMYRLFSFSFFNKAKINKNTKNCGYCPAADPAT
jgi:hypothetical protein